MLKWDTLGMLVAGLCFVPDIALAGAPTAHEIMEKNFFVSKIATMKSEATMLLVTDQGQTRERKIASLQKLQPNGIDSKLVMKFTSPPDIKGIGFLQVERSDADDDQWIYLPALKKSRRLVANNKKDSFMGSDFSYGDFARPKVDWYQHRLVRSEPVDGVDCYVVESIPRDDTIRNDHGYSRKMVWVRKENFLETKVEDYDLTGRLLKTQTIGKHKLVDPARDRWFALVREVTNHQTGHKTVLNFSLAESGVPAPEEMFSTRTIERE
jgi:hypothetical protein